MANKVYLSKMEREYRREILRDYEEYIPMTIPERNKLRNWVMSGHDIDDNPWGFVDSDGYSLSFLVALRMGLTDYEYLKRLIEEK